jgi:hypothetical protein
MFLYQDLCFYTFQGVCLTSLYPSLLHKGRTKNLCTAWRMIFFSGRDRSTGDEWMTARLDDLTDERINDLTNERLDVKTIHRLDDYTI